MDDICFREEPEEPITGIDEAGGFEREGDDKDDEELYDEDEDEEEDDEDRQA